VCGESKLPAFLRRFWLGRDARFLQWVPGAAGAGVILQSSSFRYILQIYTLERTVKTAKLFKNGESQAVRLPKEFRFVGDEVFIQRVGSAVVLLPKAKSWDTLIDSLAKFPDDFMSEREQPTDVDRREGLD
jgi:antitoxin VapB